jgi:hypothetical protein
MIQTAHARIIETGDLAGEITPVIQPVTNSRQLFDIYRLAYESYQTSDHFVPRLDGLWISHPNIDHSAQTMILTAKLDDELVGTVSMTRDGPQGVPLDQDLSRTCELIRSGRRSMAQVWRLLVKESCPIKLSILSCLLSAATQHLLSQGVQTILYLVQDKHAEECRDLANGLILTRMPSAPGLSNAQSVLMRSETENLQCVISANLTGGRKASTATPPKMQAPQTVSGRQKS